MSSFKTSLEINLDINEENALLAIEEEMNSELGFSDRTLAARVSHDTTDMPGFMGLIVKCLVVDRGSCDNHSRLYQFTDRGVQCLENLHSSKERAAQKFEFDPFEVG